MGFLRRALAAVCLLSAVSVQAGVIVLKNGDRIHGDFGSLNAETLVWQSPLLGKLTIDKRQVERIESDKELKLIATDAPCVINNAETTPAGRVWFSCGGEQKDLAINVLQNIVTYDAHNVNGATMYGKASVTGSKTEGNSESQNWDVDVDLHYDSGDYRNTLALDYDSVSYNDGDVDETQQVKYTLNWFFHERWYSFYDIAYGSDEPKNVDTRLAAGAGLGYEFEGTDKLAASVSSGLRYVDEQFDTPQVMSVGTMDRNERLNWLFGTDLTYQLPLGVNMFHRHEFIQSLEEGEDWEIDSETGFELPVMGGISSQIKYEYDYDNLPQQGNDEVDSKISIGVGYRW